MENEREHHRKYLDLERSKNLDTTKVNELQEKAIREMVAAVSDGPEEWQRDLYRQLSDLQHEYDQKRSPFMRSQAADMQNGFTGRFEYNYDSAREKIDKRRHTYANYSEDNEAHDKVQLKALRSTYEQLAKIAQKYEHRIDLSKYL